MIGEFIDEILSGDRVVFSFISVWVIAGVVWIILDWLGNTSRGRFVPKGDQYTAPEPSASRPVAGSEPRTTLPSAPPFAMRTERQVSSHLDHIARNGGNRCRQPACPARPTPAGGVAP